MFWRMCDINKVRFIVLFSCVVGSLRMFSDPRFAVHFTKRHEFSFCVQFIHKCVPLPVCSYVQKLLQLKAAAFLLSWHSSCA